MLEVREIVKGSLRSTKLRCGKANCRCARGELHDALFFSYYDEQGKPVTTSLKSQRLKRYRGPAEDYRAFREARARLVKRHREILKLFNQLEDALAIDPPRPQRKRKKGKGV